MTARKLSDQVRLITVARIVRQHRQRLALRVPRHHAPKAQDGSELLGRSADRSAALLERILTDSELLREHSDPKRAPPARRARLVPRQRPWYRVRLPETTAQNRSTKATRAGLVRASTKRSSTSRNSTRAQTSSRAIAPEPLVQRLIEELRRTEFSEGRSTMPPWAGV